MLHVGRADGQSMADMHRQCEFVQLPVGQEIPQAPQLSGSSVHQTQEPPQHR